MTDTGVGMTPEQASKVFDPFTQADVTTTRKYGGTGLGLALVSRFCRLMGGEVDGGQSAERGIAIHGPIARRGRDGDGETPVLSGRERGVVGGGTSNAYDHGGRGQRVEP